MRTPILILAAALGAAALSSNVAVTKAAASPNPGGVTVVEGEERLWSFSGTARYYDDYFDEERSMYVGGLIEADSRSEAMKMAKEAGHAQAARRGRVIAVYISTLW